MQGSWLLSACCGVCFQGLSGFGSTPVQDRSAVLCIGECTVFVSVRNRSPLCSSKIVLRRMVATVIILFGCALQLMATWLHAAADGNMALQAHLRFARVGGEQERPFVCGLYCICNTGHWMQRRPGLGWHMVELSRQPMLHVCPDFF